MKHFYASDFLSLAPEEAQMLLDGLSADEKVAWLYNWEFWARDNQLTPEGDWLTWVVLAGRGFGKTRGGSEWVRKQVEEGRQRIALVGETYKDLVEVMVYGDSGIASVFPPHQQPKVVANPSVTIEFHTGAIAHGYNATQPDQLRGPQFDAAWCDELAKWAKARETWDMLQFGLRLGDNPQAMVTTTPRSIPILREILRDETTFVTRGRTMDNAANLAQSFLDKVHKRYAGTRLGRQELDAELLEDLNGALWNRDQIDRLRVLVHRDKDPTLPDFLRVVVAVDPSGTGGEEDEGDSIGIIVVAEGVDKRYYVLADRTCKLSPAGWAKQTVKAFNDFQADRVVAERNYGGAMVEHTIRTEDPLIPYKEVVATRGKVVRAEPVAALYEQGKVSHVGEFDALEDQMMNMDSTGYVGEGSPDRVDALVWALTELASGPPAPIGIVLKGRK